MQFLRLSTAGGLTAILVAADVLAASGFAREKEVLFAELRVSTGRPDCAVELDAAPRGKTDEKGLLVLEDVEPSDHYLHVRCPDQRQEAAYFVSPHRGQRLEIRHAPGNAPSLDPARAPLEAAEAKIQLRADVHRAVRLRAQGRLEEAVELLRSATKMDPENSDLHRELGITFLLGKEWKRAQVEMLEAIRHDPSDADAHNGLGYALEKLGNLDAALKEFRTATHLDPDDPTYRQHYLEALGKQAARQAEKKK